MLAFFIRRPEEKNNGGPTCWTEKNGFIGAEEITGPKPCFQELIAGL